MRVGALSIGVGALSIGVAALSIGVKALSLVISGRCVEADCASKLIDDLLSNSIAQEGEPVEARDADDFSSETEAKHSRLTFLSSAAESFCSGVESLSTGVAAL